jgi:hypothetical protein
MFPLDAPVVLRESAEAVARRCSDALDQAPDAPVTRRRTPGTATRAPTSPTGTRPAARGPREPTADQLLTAGPGRRAPWLAAPAPADSPPRRRTAGRAAPPRSIASSWASSLHSQIAPSAEAYGFARQLIENDEQLAVRLAEGGLVRSQVRPTLTAPRATARRDDRGRRPASTSGRAQPTRVPGGPGGRDRRRARRPDRSRGRLPLPAAALAFQRLLDVWR